MNPLLIGDIFVSICEFLNIRNIITYKLISKFHNKLIRNTYWYHTVRIDNDKINNLII